jgi:uracil-DNA glycosylase
MNDLMDEIRECPEFQHLRTPDTKLVPGIGSYSPLALVVGEAPGATENARGEPFCGVSGQVLHQLMALAGLSALWRGKQTGLRVIPGCAEGVPPNVWLTNAIKFRPPGNRTPNIREILAAAPFLRREWVLVGRPRLIVCVGSVAAQAINVDSHIPERGALFLLRDRKTWICYQYHPAFGLRKGKAMQERMEAHWEFMGESMKELELL